MKKIIFFLGIVSIFNGFSSFAPPPATVTDTHLDVCDPFADMVIPCSGEVVTTTGCYSFDVHTVQNGNRANISVHIQGSLEAEGNQGNTYNVLVNSNQHLNMSLSKNDQLNTSVVSSVRFISQGSAPNYVGRLTAHLTRNANGEVTVSRFELSFDCRG